MAALLAVVLEEVAALEEGWKATALDAWLDSPTASSVVEIMFSYSGALGGLLGVLWLVVCCWWTLLFAARWLLVASAVPLKLVVSSRSVLSLLL